MELHKAKMGDEDHWRAFSYSKCEDLQEYHCLTLNGTNSDPGLTKPSSPNQELRRSKGYPWCRREDREKGWFALLEWACCMLTEYNFLTTKIEEILQTGDLQRIRYEKTKDVEVTRLFQGIYGVGAPHFSL